MVAARLGGACTTIRRPGGLRFGDVISSRIVRDGLARVEFVWIVPGRARIARAEVDLGEQTWNFVSRPRGEPLARWRIRRGEAPSLVGCGRTGGRGLESSAGHSGRPASPMRPIGPGAAIREHVT